MADEIVEILNRYDSRRSDTAARCGGSCCAGRATSFSIAPTMLRTASRSSQCGTRSGFHRRC